MPFRGKNGWRHIFGSHWKSFAKSDGVKYFVDVVIIFPKHDVLHHLLSDVINVRIRN